MNPVVLTYLLWSAIWTELMDTGNVLDGAKLHLYAGSTALTPGMVVGDLTEATFHGYASATITWTGVYLDPSTGIPTLVGELVNFISTAVFTGGQTINGWFVTDSAGTILYMARQLQTPVAISAADQILQVVPNVPVYLPK